MDPNRLLDSAIIYREFSSNEIELVATAIYNRHRKVSQLHSLDAAFDRSQYVWCRRVRQVDCGGQYGVHSGSIASRTPLRREDRPSLGNSQSSPARGGSTSHGIESNALTIENNGAI